MSLAAARYGKDLVRVFRVVRNPVTSGKYPGPVHDVAEYNVRALVEGDIAVSYTEGDNSVIVATDSIKNIIYYLAKVSPHVLTPELFAVHIGVFLLEKYAHLKRAYVDIEQLKWSRIVLDGETAGQKHSFVRDGDEKHVARVEVFKKDDSGAMEVRLTAGLVDLLVLKSTGSSFEGFIRDEFTTLPDAPDRVLSTAVDLTYKFPLHALQHGAQGIGAMGTLFDVDGAVKAAREVTLRVFCEDSPSVQATLYNTGLALLAAHGSVMSASFVLPNKHYISVDMEYLGIDNGGEVFMPIAAPSGSIAGTVAR